MKSQLAKIWETIKSLGDNQLPFSWEESDTWKQPRRKLKGSENNKQKCPISAMRKRTGPPLTKWKEKRKPYADEKATDSVMEEAVAGFCYQVKSSNALKNSRQKKPPETTRRPVACLGNSWRRSEDGYWNCSIGLCRRKPLPQYGFLYHPHTETTEVTEENFLMQTLLSYLVFGETFGKAHKEQTQLFLRKYWCRPPEQSGFRKLRSIHDQVVKMTKKNADGLNESRPGERTVLCLIDFSRTFDTVWHLGPTVEQVDLDLPNCLIR